LLDEGPETVVVTLGEDGSFTKTRDEAFHSPAFAVPVVDTTGAGDVFHGAYLFGLIRGWDLQTTAVFASAAAALKCIRLGGRAGIPAYEAVIDFLRQRDSATLGEII
jgi:ribokinase